MKILLFGANGQVGREIVAACRNEADLLVVPLTRDGADLARRGDGAKAITTAKPDIVINAAAWTQVDKAESEREAAHRINGEAPGELAAAARSVGARFIHLSTDYVFSGENSTEPLTEETLTAPINTYGLTKLEGERAALLAFPDTTIIRTSWVYSNHGSNFVRTMLRLAATRREIDIVSDQIGGPTPARAIADACLAIARREDGPGGVFHFQGAPATNWADFAEAIFKTAGKPLKIKKIAPRAYPTPAQRPLYTVLNCSKILREYGVAQPDWRLDLPATIADILKNDA